MSLNPASFNSTFLILVGFSAAFLAAIWISAGLWTYRDIRNRSRDPLVHILALLIIIILFIPGVLVYLLIRPQSTIEQKYQKNLEEEALLRSIEDTHTCPQCNRVINESWVVCPNCREPLKHACSSCSKSLELTWDICPYCANLVIGEDKPNDTFQSD